MRVVRASGARIFRPRFGLVFAKTGSINSGMDFSIFVFSNPLMNPYYLVNSC
jgi:hypothetical protein